MFEKITFCNFFFGIFLGNDISHNTSRSLGKQIFIFAILFFIHFYLFLFFYRELRF